MREHAIQLGEPPGLSHRYHIAPTGIDLHVVERPGTRTPVVLLHGIWGSWRAWLPLVTLDDDPFGSRPLFMVDLRGHGDSTKPAYGYGLRDYAGDVAAYVKTFDEPVILVGHSLGALVALGALASIGDRLAAVVLEEPPLPLPSGSEQLDPTWSSFAETVVSLSMLKRQPVEVIVARFMEQYPDLPRAGAEETAVALSKSADGVFAAIMMGDFGQQSIDLTTDAIDLPALVFQAENVDDQMLKDVGVAMLRGALPKLELVRLPGTGHSIHHWAPAEFGARVGAFLAALNPRR